MLRDLNDAWGWIQKIARRLSRLESGAMLENSSITNGRMRFIGGLLRVDSGGRVEIVGTLEIDGTTTVTGSFEVSGPWEMTGNGTITGNVTSTGTLTQNGPWHLNGDGDITGDADITGILTLLSEMVVRSGGKITVQGAGGNVVLDSSYASPRVLLGAANIVGGSSAVTITVGTTTLYIEDQTIRIPAMATKPQADYPGSFPGAVVADLSGTFYRII